MEHWDLLQISRSSHTIALCISGWVGLHCLSVDWSTGIYLYTNFFYQILFIEHIFKKTWEVILFALKMCSFLWSLVFVLDWGKRAFKFAAPSTWNQLQSRRNLWELVSLNTFTMMLNDVKTAVSGCRCFRSWSGLWQIYGQSTILCFDCYVSIICAAVLASKLLKKRFLFSKSFTPG